MKVLIVDDSKMNIKIAEDCLMEYRVVEEIKSCLSGEEALEIMQNEKIDLVLLDIVMPGLTGVDVLKIMKHEKWLDRTEVIMLTTVDDLLVLKECFEFGATDYIQKPFNKIEFAARVKSVLKEVESERKLIRALELLEKQNVELIRVNKMLKEAQSYLIEKEKMTAIGELLEGLVHEIEMPLVKLEKELNRSLSRINDLDEHISPMTVMNIKNNLIEGFDDTSDEILKIKKLIATLGNFSRNSKKDAQSSAKLSEMIEEVLLMINSEIKLIHSVEKQYNDHSRIQCNKGEIKQALMNVLINAIQAVKDVNESKIVIRTIETEDAVICHIKDNGIGIPDEYIENVFDPFFTTKPKNENMGLGLSIAYDIVVGKHKGQIEFDSDCNRGTQFSLVFNKN
ncbi:MAG: response regulator [Clostridia bacterium]|nr:response regulator [Clostridia bacterium]